MPSTITPCVSALAASIPTAPFSTSPVSCRFSQKPGMPRAISMPRRLKPPLASGPYRVGNVSVGQRIEYERVEDYWGKDLPVMRGFNHFDRIRIDFYRDRQPEFEAFKKGDIFFRLGIHRQDWATEYDFPAIQQKRVIKRDFSGEKRPQCRPGAEPAPRTFPRSACSRSHRLVFRFRMDNRKTCSMDAIPFAIAVRTVGFSSHGKAFAGRTGAHGAFSRQAARSHLRRSGIAGAVRWFRPRPQELCAALPKLLAEAGFKREGNALVDDGRQAADVELLIEAEVFGESTRPSSTTSRRSASMPFCALSTPRNISSASRILIST